MPGSSVGKVMRCVSGMDGSKVAGAGIIPAGVVGAAMETHDLTKSLEINNLILEG